MPQLSNTANGKKILIIDDDFDLTRMIQFLLETKGFAIRIANNGEEGLRQVDEYLPDLVLLDLNMPKISGIELCQKIRNRECKVNPAIIILTARANVEETLKNIRVNGFLTKPFEIEQLLKKINQVLKC